MAVAIYYQYPVGGTTPPSAAQATACQAVYAQCVIGDADTAAIITHNFGVVQPYVTAYSAGVAGAAVAATGIFPIVFVSVDQSSAGTVGLTSIALSAFVWTYLSSVSLGIKKASIVGSNATYNFVILRPWGGIAQ